MIFRTEVFPDGVIIVRVKQDSQDINGTPFTSTIAEVFKPNGALPPSNYSQALAIAQVLWTQQLITEYSTNNPQ
jgi:hypothetical protein